MKKRTASINRKTKEVQITGELNIDGKGKSNIDTGIGILDHMLELFAFHGFFDLKIKARGDLKKIDKHHTNEDVGIVLGQAFKKALGGKKGIKRFGYGSVPMEDVLAKVTVDISGRGYLSWKLEVYRQYEEDYSIKDASHFLESFAKNLGMNLNMEVSPGLSLDLHTILEPVFKALGIALDEACQIEPRRKNIPSTKGIID